MAVALIGLVLAGTAGVFSMYAMVNQVFCVPYRFRYGFGPRYIRVLLMVVLMGLGVLAVTVGSALVANVTGYAFAQRAAAPVLIWLVASSLLYVSATSLTRRTLTFREVGLGAALGGLAMTTIIGLGSVLLGRFVTSSSAVYGVFGTVVGIFSVLFLVSNAVVFCFEISVVRAWQLWPRGVDINLLFPADERAYALLDADGRADALPAQRGRVRRHRPRRSASGRPRLADAPPRRGAAAPVCRGRRRGAAARALIRPGPAGAAERTWVLRLGYSRAGVGFPPVPAVGAARRGPRRRSAHVGSGHLRLDQLRSSSSGH